MESSDFWADTIANKLGKDVEDIKKLWSDEKIKTPYDFKEDGFITGVKYLDQVESIIMNKYKSEMNLTTIDHDNAVDDMNTDYQLENEFVLQPRRELFEVRNDTEFSKEAMKKKSKMAKKLGPSKLPPLTSMVSSKSILGVTCADLEYFLRKFQKI